MPWRVRFYINLTATLAVVAGLAWTAAEHPRAEWPWWGGLLMLLACVILERRAAQMPGGNTVSIATIPHLAGIFLLPPPIAIAAAALGMFIDLARLREPSSRIVFNTANTAVTVAISALLATLLHARGADLVHGGLKEVA